MNDSISFSLFLSLFLSFLSLHVKKNDNFCCCCFYNDDDDDDVEVASPPNFKTKEREKKTDI